MENFPNVQPVNQYNEELSHSFDPTPPITKRQASSRLSLRSVKLKSSVTSHIKRSEIERQNDHVSHLQQELNALNFTLSSQKKRINDLQKSLYSIGVEIEEENSKSQVSNDLYNLIAKADSTHYQWMESITYQQVLDHMLERLKNEKIVLDAETKRLRQDLEKEKMEYETAKQAERDAKNSIIVARKLKTKAENALKEQKRLQQQKIDGLQQEVEETNKILEWREESSRNRHNIIRNARGDLSPEEERKLKKKNLAIQLKQIGVDRNKRIETRQLDEYLRAFNQIREVTGLSDIHKMVERFVAQESSMSQLEQMIKEMQSKLDRLQLEKESAETLLNDLRFSGLDHLSQQRKDVDTKEEELIAVKTQLRNIENEYRHSVQVVTNIKQGVTNLLIRLEDTQIPFFASQKDGNDHLVDKQANAEKERIPRVNDENIAAMLSFCERKVVQLTETLTPADIKMLQDLLQQTLPSNDSQRQSNSSNNIQAKIENELDSNLESLDVNTTVEDGSDSQPKDDTEKKLEVKIESKLKKTLSITENDDKEDSLPEISRLAMKSLSNDVYNVAIKKIQKLRRQNPYMDEAAMMQETAEAVEKEYKSRIQDLEKGLDTIRHNHKPLNTDRNVHASQIRGSRRQTSKTVKKDGTVRHLMQREHPKRSMSFL